MVLASDGFSGSSHHINHKVEHIILPVVVICSYYRAGVVVEEDLEGYRKSSIEREAAVPQSGAAGPCVTCGYLQIVPYGDISIPQTYGDEGVSFALGKGCVRRKIGLGYIPQNGGGYDALFDGFAPSVGCYDVGKEEVRAGEASGLRSV